MRNFTCQCGAALYFDSSQCLQCGAQVALDPRRWEFVSLATSELLLCNNGTAHGVCNWLVTEPGAPLCSACGLNQVVPDLSVAEHPMLWRRVEVAKRQVLYTLAQLGLFPVIDDGGVPLRFEILADAEAGSHFRRPLPGEKVFTGHMDGVITLNLAEADDVAVQETRIAMGETYRTLLGTLRHEIGHYYWYRLVAADAAQLDDFRHLFGDERQDYGQALEAYYECLEQGGNTWTDAYVSSYASSHPWEDWAETWAHLLHLLDTLETARSCSLHLREEGPTPGGEALGEVSGFDDIFAQWCRLSVSLNLLNRSMGLRDAYPFVLAEAVKRKLYFVYCAIDARGDSPLQRLLHSPET